MLNNIGVIVEGKAENDAANLIIRRILHELLEKYTVGVCRPFRLPRGKMTKADEIERAVPQLIGDRNNVAGILILADADDDCPPGLAENLAVRASLVTSVPVCVCIAVREFESWFLWGLDSLKGNFGIPADVTFAKNPDEVRDAKGSLTSIMVDRRYLEVDDQPSMSRAVDLNLVRDKSRSFDKFVRSVEKLTSEI